MKYDIVGVSRVKNVGRENKRRVTNYYRVEVTLCVSLENLVSQTSEENSVHFLGKIVLSTEKEVEQRPNG